MKRVRLHGTSIEASALGFGCSSLLGKQTAAQGLELLRTAYECGIRYFDVAPAYGQGAAEAILGEFAEGHRSELVLATKFGIEPSLPAVARSPFVRSIARKVMRGVPGLRRVLGRASSATLAMSRFQPVEAKASIERSLRLLRTNYIDVLLLHECRPEDLVNSDELLQFLHRMIAEGKIRAFGVGTSVLSVVAICDQFHSFASVVQFSNSVLRSNLDEIHGERAVITHGGLGGSFSALSRELRQKPEKGNSWSATVGANCQDSKVLSELMLSWCLRANQNGPVLFSSTDRNRIRRNVSALEASSFTDDQLDRFAKLAREAGIHPD